MSIAYHLQELEIAKDADDPRNVLPEVRPSDQTILDVGCGIGQTLVALDCPSCRRIGIDIDAEAIAYAGEIFPELELHAGPSDVLPLDDDSVDLVVLRVALPYMNIPTTIREVQRVLKAGGRLWLTVHSRRMAWGFLKDAIRKRDVKNAIHKTYVMLNGYLFQWTGRLVPFVNGRYESWQDVEVLKQYFDARGFSSVVGGRNGYRFVEATKLSASNESTSVRARRPTKSGLPTA